MNTPQMTAEVFKRYGHRSTVPKYFVEIFWTEREKPEPLTRGFAIWRDRIWAELWIIDELLNNLPSDINTDYRHIAKPWPLAAMKRLTRVG